MTPALGAQASRMHPLAGVLVPDESDEVGFGWSSIGRANDPRNLAAVVLAMQGHMGQELLERRLEIVAFAVTIPNRPIQLHVGRPADQLDERISDVGRGSRRLVQREVGPEVLREWILGARAREIDSFGRHEMREEAYGFGRRRPRLPEGNEGTLIRPPNVAHQTFEERLHAGPRCVNQGGTGRRRDPISDLKVSPARLARFPVRWCAAVLLLGTAIPILIVR